MIRRKDNKPMPVQTGNLRKRDSKATQKEEQKRGQNGAKEEKKIED